MLCVICGDQEVGPLVNLTNGEHVHATCARRPPLIDPRHSALSARLSQLQAQLLGATPRYTMWGRLFGDNKEDQRISELKTAISAEINELSVSIKMMTQQLRERKLRFIEVQTRCFDYWPDYPPDWDRRAQIARNGRCAQCRTADVVHVHHKTPLSLGGDNKRDNLVGLCFDCHQSRHFHSIGSASQVGRAGRKSTSKKPMTAWQQLKLAASHNKTVRIEYTNGDGERSKRVIKIKEGFRAKDGRKFVKAYCYKRKEERTFRVDRISAIEIGAG